MKGQRRGLQPQRCQNGISGTADRAYRSGSSEYKGSDQMICPKCKNEVTGRFCSYCGALLQPDGSAEDLLKGPDRKAGKSPLGAGREFSGDSGSGKGQMDPEEFPWEEMDLGQTTGEIRASQQLARALRGEENLQAAKPGSGPADENTAGQDRGDTAVQGRKTSGTAASGTKTPGKDRTAASGRVKVKNTTKKKTKVKRKGKNPLSSAVSSAASAAAGGTRTVWKTAVMLLQVICFVLMAYLTLRFVKEFWDQRSALGALQGILAERNLAAAVYVAAAVCTGAFGAVQALWSLGRKKFADHGRLRRYDAGRGMMGFFVFLLLGLAARYVSGLLPSGLWLFLGIRQYFAVISAMGGSMIALSLLGIVLCVVRKVGTR